MGKKRKWKVSKFRIFKWIGNLIIWGTPLFMVFFAGIKSKEAYENMSILSRVYLWTLPILFILFIIYWKKGKQVLHDKLLKNEIQERAPNPIYVLLTGMMALLPIALLYFAFKIMFESGENIEKALLILLVAEAIGRWLLVIDSFSCLVPNDGKDD